MALDYLVLVLVLINALIGISVLVRNIHAKRNQFFFAFVVSLAFWIASNFLENAPAIVGIGGLPLFLRFDFAFAILIVYFWMRFCSTFADTVLGRKFWHAYGPLILFGGFLAAASLVSDLIITDIQFSNTIIQFREGLLWPLYALFIVGCSLGGLVLLFIAKRQARRKGAWLTNQQINLIFVGFFLSIGNAIIINLFLQTFLPISLEVSRLGLYGMTALAVLTGYAISRQQLFDIRLVIARSVSFLLVMGVLIFAYALLFFAIATNLFGLHLPSLVFWSIVGLTVIAIVAFPPLERLFRKLTNAFFFKGLYDSEKLLSELARIMAQEIDIAAMNARVLKQLSDDMHITKLAFVMPNRASGKKVYVHGYDESAVSDLPFEDIVPLSRENIVRHTTLDQLQEERWKKLWRQHDIQVAIPLYVEHRVVAILLLGSKRTGEIYYPQDLRVLDIFTSEAGIAIQNANLYTSLRKASQAKSKFISVVSHQLRTPISSIRWSLEAAQGPGRVKKQHIGAAYHSTLFLGEQIDDIITALDIYDRTLAVKKEKVQPTLLLDGILKEFEALIATKNVSVTVGLATGASEIMADKERLRKVLSILVRNSITYSKPGGAVTVKSEAQDKRTVVSVHDDGIGIADEAKPHIFEEFFRSERSRLASPDGLGLGLFIAKAFTEAQGGEIWFESPGPDAGSTFSIALPRE